VFSVLRQGEAGARPLGRFGGRSFPSLRDFPEPPHDQSLKRRKHCAPSLAYIGDLDMVYGPDVESDDELDENAGWTTKAQIWAWQKKRGYLPIRDRRQMLRKHLEAKHRDGLSGDVQPTAAPNGGPATVPGESGVTEGPPSVARSFGTRNNASINRHARKTARY